MTRASSSRNFSIEIVLDHHNLLRSIWIRLEDPLDRSVCSLSLTASDVPGIADHELEVIITVDTGTQIFVVVLKLFNGNNLVSLMGLPDRHEVSKDLIGCFTTTLEVWVEADVIGDSDIIDSDLATSILIKNAIGLVNHIETALVETATDGAQKLIER